MTAPLLDLRGISKEFPVGGGAFRASRSLHALRDVSLQIRRGEALGLVGESGSGKSTLGNVVLGLTSPTSGSVQFNGETLTGRSQRELQPFRRQMQLVFQDPFSSLNPTQSIGAMLGEILSFHRMVRNRSEKLERIADLLKQVGLPVDVAGRFPHEFSGGQRQRIVIARALATDPDFIVADEPVSALDVSIQAQIVQLIQKLRRERQLTLLLIAHDLGLVQHMSDRVGVLYLGRLVELAPTRKLFSVPKHPYTEMLLSVVPTIDGRDPSRRIKPRGEIPSPMSPPSGCVFRTRCQYAIPACAETVPPLSEVDEGHLTACIRSDEVGKGANA